MKNLNRLIVAIIIGILIILPVIPAYAKEEEDTQPVSEISVTKLWLDNQNKYDGMDRSYSEGYIPRVENGIAYIVVPILCNGELKNNSLTASLNLGDTENMPFVCKNYEKTIYFQQSNVNDGTAAVNGYVASFALELKGERYNGSYPVVAAVHAEDKAGQEILQEFTLYVNITDGKERTQEETAEPATEAPPVFAPKVLVQSYKFSKDVITAGEEVTVDITLINTSKEEMVKNMTVTVKEQGEYFSLKNASDSTYVENIPAGGTAVVSYSYQIHAGTPQGQYDFEVAMDYNDSKGGTYAGAGNVKLNVSQPVQVQFDSLKIEEKVQVADVVTAQIQAMNLGRGKVYNVRAVIEADGLIPDGTLVIGDMEAGQAAAGSTQVTVSSLTQGSNIYGETTGNVTFYYTDESGKEYQESKEFSTIIASPFSDESQKVSDEPEQWWIIMAVMAGGVLIFIICIAIRIRKRRRLMNEVV